MSQDQVRLNTISSFYLKIYLIKIKKNSRKYFFKWMIVYISNGIGQRHNMFKHFSSSNFVFQIFIHVIYSEYLVAVTQDRAKLD